MSAYVTVYNQGGAEYLGRVSLHHAITMIHKGKAIVKDFIEGAPFGPYERPTAVELVRYVHAKWKYDRKGVVPFSKKGVLRRDGHVCAYCGGHATTVDHVMPKWEGNAATWNNSVAACFPCNNKKGGRSPAQAGMPIKYVRTPWTPSFADAYRWSHVEDIRH